MQMTKRGTFVLFSVLVTLHLPGWPPNNIEFRNVSEEGSSTSLWTGNYLEGPLMKPSAGVLDN